MGLGWSRYAQVFALRGRTGSPNDGSAAYGATVDVHDPWVDPAEAKNEYGISLTEEPAPGEYDVVVLAVAHEQFREMGEQGIKAYGKPGSVFFDIKYLLPQGSADGRL